MSSKKHKLLTQRLANQCLEKKILLVTAESCTGGLLSATLTKIAGSSKWFDRGYITYSNNSKIDSLRKKVNTIIKNICKKNKCKFTINYDINGDAFLTKPEKTTILLSSSEKSNMINERGDVHLDIIKYPPKEHEGKK